MVFSESDFLENTREQKGCNNLLKLSVRAQFRIAKKWQIEVSAGEPLGTCRTGKALSDTTAQVEV